MTNNVDRLVDTVDPNDFGAGEIATALAAIVAAWYLTLMISSF
ncbi:MULTISPECIES: hypothetical protein [Rhizobium]|jgi:hypothetical protein|nr:MULTISPECIES: hypothetical protein [Rhizobium]